MDNRKLSRIDRKTGDFFLYGANYPEKDSEEWVISNETIEINLVERKRGVFRRTATTPKTTISISSIKASCAGVASDLISDANKAEISRQANEEAGVAVREAMDNEKENIRAEAKERTAKHSRILGSDFSSKFSEQFADAFGDKFMSDFLGGTDFVDEITGHIYSLCVLMFETKSGEVYMKMLEAGDRRVVIAAHDHLRKMNPAITDAPFKPEDIKL